MIQKKKTIIYTNQFWLLCISSMLFFASFSMIIPELPSYLTRLGGAGYKGLIISLFTVTAMLSRPFSGKLSDTIGRVPVMIFGAVVCFLCSLMYPWLTTVTGFLVLRFVHGFSTGFTPTGQTTYLADIIPATKRGEAVGLLGTAGTLGMALGPAIGGAIANRYGLSFMFYSSSLCGLISILILSKMKETLQEKRKFSISAIRVSRNDLFEPNVLLPCFMMVLIAYAYGAVFTVISDFSAFVGINNKGLIFTYITGALLIVRLLAGRASDKYGRIPVLKISILLIAISMLVVSFAASPSMLILGCFMYGLAHGATSPTLLAWATDLSDETHRGRGIGSLYISMEFGIGIGAFSSGLLYGNNNAHIPIVFLTAATLSFIGFVYLMINPVKKLPIKL
jgi:MFS family permease